MAGRKSIPQKNPGNMGRAQSGKAPKGAKRRAVAALVGNKAAAGMSDAEVRCFWDARLHKFPPAIRTSFGNFSTINAVDRWTWLCSATRNYCWVPWSPSALASIDWSSATGAPRQHIYDIYNGASANQVRPLRMSVSIENVGQLINSGGDVRVYSLDQAIVTNILTTALASGNAGFSNQDFAQALIDGSPDTMSYPIASLTDEHTFVSAPASYPSYNSYFEFINLGNSVDGTQLQSYDAWQLVEDVKTYDSYPASTLLATGLSSPGKLGSTPPMRGFLIEVTPPTSGSQTLRICTHRQDGARFPVNTLGHSFATCPAKMSAQAEDALLAMTRHVSGNPGVGVATKVLDGLGNFAEGLNAVLAGTAGQAAIQGLTRLARPALTNALRNSAVSAMRLMIT